MEPNTNTEIFLLPEGQPPLWRRRSFVIWSSVIGVLILGAAGLLYFIARPPADFPSGYIISIPEKATLSEVASILKDQSVIRSSDAFKIASLVFGAERGAMAGDYLFSTPTPVWEIASRIAHGEQGLTRIKVTLPEGTTVREIATILLKQIPDFDAAGFTVQALPFEGYLFPDTYFFFPNVKPAEVIHVMRTEFTDKYAAILAAASTSRSQDQIVNLASIVEKEASTPEDWAVVAGILWKRFDRGMALQVDAPFLYTVGKASKDLTLDDLKVESPYNTYLHKGLPKTPIDNPGAGALAATLAPTSTPYWFYLSDDKGVMHYAKTYEDHLANKAKYLK